MGKILPVLVILLAVGGAGFAAKTLRSGGDAAYAAAADGAGEAGDGGKVKAVEAEGGNGYGYFDFKRNFIVPVIRGERVDAITLLTLSVEMPEDDIAEAKTREPKIRDAFMKVLLTMSHEGYFAADITSPQVYEQLQGRLIEEAKRAIQDDVQSVLIVDFARQDQ